MSWELLALTVCCYTQYDAAPKQKLLKKYPQKLFSAFFYKKENYPVPRQCVVLTTQHI